MGEPTKKYRGPFCTGHTFFPMTAVMSYTEAIQGEFRDEYKQAHGNFKRAAPGEMQNGPDFRAIIASGRRAPNAVPLAGTPTDRIMHGGRPERRGKVSSSDVGGWWDDPLFQELHDEVDRQKGSPPHCIGKSTTGEIGRYWHDPELEYTDEHTEAARLKNGVKKGFQEATVSRFALEALPIEHRLL